MLSDAFLFKIQEIDIIYASFNAIPFCPSSNAAEHRAQHGIEPHPGGQTDRLQKALLFPDVLHDELSCWRQAVSKVGSGKRRQTGLLMVRSWL